MSDMQPSLDLWDAINAVVVASGGSAGNTSTARQNAVVKVERAIAALVRREVEQARADEREAWKHALESRDMICEALQRELGPERTLRALGFDPARVAQSRREIAEGKTVSLDEIAAAIRARGEQPGTGEGGGGRG